MILVSILVVVIIIIIIIIILVAGVLHLPEDVEGRLPLAALLAGAQDLR